MGQPPAGFLYQKGDAYAKRMHFLNGLPAANQPSSVQMWFLLMLHQSFSIPTFARQLVVSAP
jgi:hypothetical protein